MFCKVNATLSADAAVLRKLEGLTATLWDADPVEDDRLASAAVKDGKAEFLLDLEDASSLDSPAETKPDLFITVTDPPPLETNSTSYQTFMLPPVG